MKKIKYNKSVNKFFNSILKLKLAIALFILLSLIVNAADVVVDSGKLDAVGDITGNRICIGTDCRTSWPSGSSGSLPSGTLGQTLRNDGTNWIASSLLNNTGNDNIQIEKNNEVYLNLKNTETNGRQYALISAGSAGGIGIGKFSIYDKTADANRLTIDSSGNVGIGTISPVSKLHVAGTTGSGSRVYFTKAGDSSDPIVLNLDNSPWASGTPQTEIRLDTALTGDGGNAQAFIGVERTADRVGDLYFRTRNVNSYSEKVRITSTGSVGIGTASPSEKLTVNGNVLAAAYFYSSDANLKTNIQKLDGLKIISGLQGVSFNWKDSGKSDLGLIAQDVEKVLPELVATDSSTGLKSVKYGNLVAPLIEATKELKEQNKNQSIKIAELKKELDLLRTEIKKEQIKVK